MLKFSKFLLRLPKGSIRQLSAEVEPRRVEVKEEDSLKHQDYFGVNKLFTVKEGIWILSFFNKVLLYLSIVLKEENKLKKYSLKFKINV